MEQVSQICSRVIYDPESAYRDVGVAVRAVAGDAGQVLARGRAGAGAAERDLSALGVELGRVRLVERDQLVPDEVVSGREVGDRARPRLVPADELGDAPAGGLLAVEEHRGAVALEAGLVDLEPGGAGAVAGAELALTLVHPDDHGALRVRPLLPRGGDGVAGLGGRRLRGARAAVAGELGRGAALDGVVVGPLPLDDLGIGVGRESLVSKFCLASLYAVDSNRSTRVDSPRVFRAGNIIRGHSPVGSGPCHEEGNRAERRGGHGVCRRRFVV